MSAEDRRLYRNYVPPRPTPANSPGLSDVAAKWIVEAVFRHHGVHDSGWANIPEDRVNGIFSDVQIALQIAGATSADMLRISDWLFKNPIPSLADALTMGPADLERLAAAPNRSDAPTEFHPERIEGIIRRALQEKGLSSFGLVGRDGASLEPEQLADVKQTLVNELTSAGVGRNDLETYFAGPPPPFSPDLYDITPAERVQLDAFPVRLTAEDWRSFAWSLYEGVIDSYARGETDFEQMMSAMRLCSLGCRSTDRLLLLGLTVERALRITPKSLNRRRPPFPTWLKRASVAVVRLLKEMNPAVTSGANELSDWSSPVLVSASAWLVSLALCDPKNPIPTHTLYKWYRASMRVAGRPSAPGRPRKTSPKSTAYSTEK